MKKITPLLYVVLIAVLIIVGKKTIFKSKPLEIPKYGNYLSCIGYPFDLKFKFTSSTILAKDSLPEKQESKNRLYYSAAFFQNMYTFTNIHDYNLNTNLKWSSLSDKDPSIKVIKVEDIPYPVDVELSPGTELSGFPPEATMYLTSLFEKGKIKKDDPAVKVTYEYENDVQMCFTENKVDLSKIKFVQPVDPYMSYYFVPITDRRPIANPVRKVEQVINPCINPEGMSPSVYSPFVQWFTWRPFAEGHDLNKKPFNCNDYYKDKVTLNTLNVSVTENIPKETAFLAFDKFENLDRPLTASIFLGAQETKTFKKFDIIGAKRFISLFLSGIDTQTARKEIPEIQKNFDPKFATFLWFMRNVTEQMEVKISEYDVNEYSAGVTLKGKLKLSRKDIVIKIFIHQNNSKFEGSDYFAKSFADEFLNNDVVIYGGHATMGNVFAESFQKYGDVMKQKQNKKLDYQIMALFSCTAGFYFNGDKFPGTDHAEFQRDFIRTGGGFTDGSANSSLILLGQIDSYLYNKKYAPFAYWSKMAKADNFYILSNH